MDKYDVNGQRLSNQEGHALSATVHTLASLDDPTLAREIWKVRLSALWQDALTVKAQARYYSHNWMWFDRATQQHLVGRSDEFLAFLRPFDTEGFAANFPLQAFLAMLVLYFPARRNRFFKFLFLALAFPLSLRYLIWRGAIHAEFYRTVRPSDQHLALAH